MARDLNWVLIMIKETKKEIIKVEEEFYCDVCHKKFDPYYQYQSISCYICKRHLCGEHRITDEHDHSDYPNVYCPDCNKIIKKYDKELSAIEEESDRKMEQIIIKRDKECLENVKRDKECLENVKKDKEYLKDIKK